MGERIQGSSIRNHVRLTAVLAAMGCLAATSANAAKPEAVPGELVVRLKGVSSAGRVQAAVIGALQDQMGSGAVVDIEAFQTDTSLHKIVLGDAKNTRQAILALSSRPEVEIAEPNYIYRMIGDAESDIPNTAAAPNDPELTRLWGMFNTGQVDSSGQAGKEGSDIGVFPLWQKGITGSKSVLVAVIDTGMDLTHPDLKDNLYTNPKEIAGNGKDDDSNGFVDDVHGWNFATGSNNPNDDQDHGSHVSGTIGAKGNNGVGVVGVNWNVSILPVKFLDANGSGSLANAVESINYARKMKVKIMSNSWGGGGFSQTMLKAIQDAKKDGILFVAAAGNDGSSNDTSPTYPASYVSDNVLAVAAIDNQEQLASFSNYGKSVHVAAPGVRVYSTVKGGLYNTFSGTSMATPHVSGVAALLLSKEPGLTYAQVKDRLIKTSVPVSSLRRRVQAKGRVSAYNVINNIIPPSSEPDETQWKDVAYSLESEHPYANNTDKSFTIQEPGAKYIRVIFDQVDTEPKYDIVSLQSSSREPVEVLSGKHANYASDYVVGDTAVLQFQSDSSVNAFGFKITRIQVIK